MSTTSSPPARSLAGVPGDVLKQMGTNAGSFLGALVSRCVPPVAQIVFLFVTAREAGIRGVGAFASVSALSYTLGSIAEAGFATAFSASSRYYDVDVADLLGRTRRVRVGLAGAASLLLLVLLGAGFAGGSPGLYWALPLPFAIALSTGYSGAFGRVGRLTVEGRIAAFENATAIVACLAISTLHLGLGAIIASIGLVRLAATGVRAHRLSRLVGPISQSSGPVSGISVFGVFTGLTVLQGQADLVVLGLVNFTATAGMYAPLVRIAYAPALFAEALTFAILPTLASRHSGRDPERVLTKTLLLAGVVAAGTVFLTARTLFGLVVGTQFSISSVLLTILAACTFVRFLAYGSGAILTARGQQLWKTVVTGLAAFTILVCSWVGVSHESVSLVAMGRLGSELLLVGGFATGTRREHE